MRRLPSWSELSRRVCILSVNFFAAIAQRFYTAILTMFNQHFGQRLGGQRARRAIVDLRAERGLVLQQRLRHEKPRGR